MKKIIAIITVALILTAGMYYIRYGNNVTFTLSGDKYEQIQPIRGLVKVTSPEDRSVIFIDVVTGNNYAIPQIRAGESETIKLEKGRWYRVEDGEGLALSRINVRIGTANGPDSFDSEMEEAEQVINEFCLDNGYTAQSVDCLEGGDGCYVYELIVSRNECSKRITLTIEKMDNGWEVTNQYSPAICIDDVTYYDTGKTVSVEPDESVIEHVEIPAGAQGTITAFARLEEGTMIVCLINGEWIEFDAEQIK